MRKLILILLVVATLLPLLCGCVDKNEYALLCEILKNANLEEKYNCSFRLSITNLETETNTCFLQGNANIDKSDGLKMNGSMSQDVLGGQSKANIAFYNDEYYTEVGDNRTITDMPEESIKMNFLFGDAPIFDVSTVKKLDVKSDGLQRTYSYTSTPPKYILDNLISADIYKMAAVFSPDYTLTEYKNVESVMIVTEGDSAENMRLVTRFLKFEMHMYSQMPYIPGVTPNKEDYLTRVEVVCQMTYNAFGNSVKVDLPDRADYKKSGE